MTKDETKTILKIIIAAYPNFKPQDIKMTVELWAVMLADYDYKLVEIALKSYIATNTTGFAPEIGKLIDIIHSQRPEEKITDMQAWSVVRKAIGNGYYHYKEEFEKLPEVLKSAVGNEVMLKEWAALDTKTVDSVIQSNFLRNYAVARKRQETDKRLPSDVKKQIKLLEG